MDHFTQSYDPLHNVFLSTLAAAVPILTLLYLLAVHPTRSNIGSLHKGIAAHKAAMVAVLVALLVSTVIFHMPVKTAGMSLVFGAMFGIFPIGLIVIGAMFLYTITLVTGLFDVLKDSVASFSDDPRVQAILIAFSFGAFMEGCAGFGCPVAISGALLVGMGFRPFQAAVLCLIANTAPVAFGSLGIPITSLAAVTGIDTALISKMAARQLPFFSLIIPIWMTAVQVKMDGRPWRDVFAVWPALLIAGGSFAITQFLIGNYLNYQLVDIAGGLVSLFVTAGFCKFWRPSTPYTTSNEGPDEVRVSSEPSGTPILEYASHRHRRPSAAMIARAWLPWALLTVMVFLFGHPWSKHKLESIPHSVVTWEVPAVNGVVYRAPPVVQTPKADEAIYKINWLTASGTAIVLTAILSGLFLRLSINQWKLAIVRSAARLRLPVLTIALILSMGFITKYSGMDAVLGLAFTRTGWLYPFFAAMLGWLGVALTGSDTSSNVMFGSMQKITAEQANLPPVLIVTANSTGGVMGKMIDAQSIVVATAATYEDEREAKLAAGPIFRAVLPHSFILAALMGLLTLLQAYVWKGMIPH